MIQNQPVMGASLLAILGEAVLSTYIYRDSKPPEPTAVNFLTNSPTAAASRPRFRSIVSTIALPTTTASAKSPTSANCSEVEIPNPRATGNFVTRRRRFTSFRASSASCCRWPVTPVRDTAYTNPRDASAIRFSRSSGLVGAARNTGDKSYSLIACKYSPASSTGKSVTSAPSTPAARATLQNFSIPIRRIGFNMRTQSARLTAPFAGSPPPASAPAPATLHASTPARLHAG